MSACGGRAAALLGRFDSLRSLNDRKSDDAKRAQRVVEFFSSRSRIWMSSSCSVGSFSSLSSGRRPWRPDAPSSVHREHEHEVDHDRHREEADERADEVADREGDRSAPDRGNRDAGNTVVAGFQNTSMSGVMMDATIALTTAVNAAPMTTATARSMTLPRMMKSLKPLITVPPVLRRAPVTIPTKRARTSPRTSMMSKSMRPRQRPAGGGRTRVGAVEAGTVEGHADGSVLLAQSAAALGTLRQAASEKDCTASKRCPHCVQA
jgi:hypothetical protein